MEGHLIICKEFKARSTTNLGHPALKRSLALSGRYIRGWTFGVEDYVRKECVIFSVNSTMNLPPCTYKRESVRTRIDDG